MFYLLVLKILTTQKNICPTRSWELFPSHFTLSYNCNSSEVARYNCTTQGRWCRRRLVTTWVNLTRRHSATYSSESFPLTMFLFLLGENAIKSNTKSVSLGFFVEHLFCSAFKTLNKAQGGMGQAKPNPSLSATSLVSRMFEIVAEFSKFQKPVSTGKKTPAKSSGYFSGNIHQFKIRLFGSKVAWSVQKCAG